MVIGDSTPVWSDLGQTTNQGQGLPGSRMPFCSSDVFGQSCPVEELFGLGDDGVFGGDDSMFGLGTVRIPDTDGLGTVRVPDAENAFGQVLFPNIKRADYAVNPLSGVGQVLFPNIKRADYAVNPLSGMGTVRVPDDSNAFSGYFGQAATAAPSDLKAKLSSWGLATWVAAAALYGGSILAKGNLKEALRAASYVAGGLGVVGLAKKLID